jgi:hypothetical protein
MRLEAEKIRLEEEALRKANPHIFKEETARALHPRSPAETRTE